MSLMLGHNWEYKPLTSYCIAHQIINCIEFCHKNTYGYVNAIISVVKKKGFFKDKATFTYVVIGGIDNNKIFKITIEEQ